MRRRPRCHGELPPEAFYTSTCKKPPGWCIQCCRDGAQMRRNMGREVPDSLYVATNRRIPGEIKIGRAQNPFKRLRDLGQCQNFHVELVKSWPGLGHLEPKLHQQFSDFRVLHVPGREWFSIDPSDIGLIENCVDFLLQLQAAAEKSQAALVP